MKVQNLIEAIEHGKRAYHDFCDWDVAVEQHPRYKKCCNCKDSFIKDSENTGYLKSHAGICAGVWFYSRKIFGINIHY